VDKTEYRAIAAAHSASPAQFWDVFDEVTGRIAGRFSRVEPRRNARDLLLGLLSPIERKNGWWLAEHAGHISPDLMQRLLRTAVWDDRQVRAEGWKFVVERLGDAASGVLIADETGYLKKGRHSAGVQRQYTGTAGRIENTQVGVFLSYASRHGRALVDARLYMPRSWMADPDRRATAGIPADLEFATKPQLALQMIEDALDAGVQARFVTADEAYGLDPFLRTALQRRGTGYVLAVARNHRIAITGAVRERVDATAAQLPDTAWRRYQCGPGSKGPRYYDWAWIAITDTEPGCHSLLVRRASDGELAFYRCWTPQPVTLSTLIRVAGARWAVEETFQLAKGQIGLDHYQCRQWTAWYRFTTLAMLAMAILTALAALAPPPPTGLIALTVAEVRRLVNALILTHPAEPRLILHWSLWRRHHQKRAQISHFKRRHDLELNR
jgi:SRSO17 transposase